MRFNALHFFTNTSVMMSNLFIPILAYNLGATGTEIGIIGAAYGAAFFFSSFFFSRAADQYPPKTLLYVGFSTAAVSFFLQMFAYDALSLGILRALAGFSVGIYPAVLILYVYNLKRSIGKFSSFMPLGWAFGNLIAGIVAVEWEIFSISSLLFAISFLITMTLPETGPPSKKKVNYFSIDILKKNWNIYSGFFLRQVGANNVWIVFPLYLAYLHADKLWIGIIYMLNPTLQFFIMRRLDKYKNRSLIHAGDLLSMLAFAALIPLTEFYQAIAGLTLIAFSYSCLYIGSTNYLIENNAEKGQAAGLLNSAISLANVIGSIVGGVVMQFFGFQVVMAVGAVFSFLGYAAIKIKASNEKT